MQGVGCADVLLYFKCPTTKQMRCPVNAYRLNPLFPNHFEQPQDSQPEQSNMDKHRVAGRIEVNGIVQGVGFRPFIYNLALRHGLKGEVSNTSAGVAIVVEVSR